MTSVSLAYEKEKHFETRSESVSPNITGSTNPWQLLQVTKTYIQEFITGQEIVYEGRKWKTSEIERKFPMWRVYYNNKKFKFLKPLQVTAYKVNNLYYMENEKLNVFSYGYNFDEALKDFESHISHFVEYYKNISDDKLTAKALEYKRLFEEFVQEET